MKKKDEFNRKLKGRIRCPICRQDYLPDDLTELGGTRNEEAQSGQKAFYLYCHKCGSSSVIFVSDNKTGTLVAGAATDLSIEEIYKFSQEEAISDREIIEAYKFFHKNGDK